MNIVLCKIMSLLWENDISEKEFCAKLGFHSGIVTEWKHGRTKSYERHIEKIAGFFDVPKTYLSNIYDLSLDTAAYQEYDMYDKQLMLYFHELNEDGKREAIAHTEYLSTQGRFKKSRPDEAGIKDA